MNLPISEYTLGGDKSSADNKEAGDRAGRKKGEETYFKRLQDEQALI